MTTNLAALKRPEPMDRLDISPDRYDEIAGEITSDSSPVGIDAKKTHVLILHLLLEMRQRLDRIEERLGRLEGAG